MATEMGRILETVLSAPGMGDSVKLTLSITRKNIFLLAKIIERGMSEKPDQSLAGLVNIADELSMQALRGTADDLLQKAGLTDLYQKLNALK